MGAIQMRESETIHFPKSVSGIEHPLNQDVQERVRALRMPDLVLVECLKILLVVRNALG